MWVCAVLPKGFEPRNPISPSLLFSWVIEDGTAEVSSGVGGRAAVTIIMKRRRH